MRNIGLPFNFRCGYFRSKMPLPTRCKHIAWFSSSSKSFFTIPCYYHMGSLYHMVSLSAPCQYLDISSPTEVTY